MKQVGLTVIAVLVLGAGALGVARAQTTTTTTTTASTTTTTGATTSSARTTGPAVVTTTSATTTGGTTAPCANAAGPGGQDWKGMHEKFLAALAARLGLQVDDLKQKFEAAKQDAGFPQHQAGQGPGGGPWQRGPGQAGAAGGPGPGHEHGAGLASVAKLFNISVDDLSTQLKGGATLADLATKYNVKRDDVANTLIAEHKARIQQLVTDQRITQTQADSMLANLGDRVNRMMTTSHQMSDGCGRPWGERH